MLDSDEIQTLRINNKKIVIKINKKYGTVKVDNIFFNSLGALKSFINKLSDITEEMENYNNEL